MGVCQPPDIRPLNKGKRVDKETFFDAEQFPEEDDWAQDDQQEDNYCLHVLATETNTPDIRKRYNSDSFLIAVDNCCSRYITNCMTDFVELPRRVKM
jgi:hypothetical protein